MFKGNVETSGFNDVLRLRVFWRHLDEDTGQASLQEFGSGGPKRSKGAYMCILFDMLSRVLTIFIVLQ